jgi:hypothetical protein
MRCIPSTHTPDLLAITLTHNIHYVVIKPGRCENMAKRQQSIHPICCFIDLMRSEQEWARKVDTRVSRLIILVTASVILPRSHYPVKNTSENSSCIGNSSQHKVTYTSMVSCRDVYSRRRGEGSLLTEPDTFHDLQGKREITEEDMHAQKADYGEISEHTI